jgi:hypothetical protein
MWENLEARLMDIVKPIFPNNAEIRRRPSSDGLELRVVWKLTNDANRPNKRSRRIILVVSEEALEDYNDGNHDVKEKRIMKVITERLKGFNPNHNTPYGQPEPEELWALI